ncbi:MAG: hypothetical protein ABIG63_10275 [Chloroflexota bacterium]
MVVCCPRSAVDRRSSVIPKRRYTAIPQHDFNFEQMIGGHAVDDGVGAGGVVGNDTPHGGAVGGGRVGSELETVGRGGPVERAEHDARLDGDSGVGSVKGQDAVEVA